MSTSCWTANLQALGRVDPGLRKRLTAAPVPARVRREADGTVLWDRGLTPTRIALAESSIDAVLADLGEGSAPCVLVGMGAGALLVALLDHTERDVIVWERDVGFLRAGLQCVDVSAALVSGRLRLAAGSDWLELHGLPRVVHPILGAGCTDELAFVGDRPRALLVDGTLFVDDVGEALRAQGWDVFRWDVRHLPTSELERTARALGPDVVFGINHTNGLAEACAELGVPLVEWEIDPSTDTIVPTSAPGATVWTWRHSQVPAWRKAGYQAHYLPLAANPARRSPGPVSAEEEARYGVPVAYVGSSMLERGHALLGAFVQTFAAVYGDAEAGRQIAAQLLEVQARLAHDQGFVLPDYLHRLAPDLGERFALAGCRHRPDALLGEAAAARYRLDVLASIADLGLHVWGDPGWEALAGAGATIRGWAGHYRELTRIYRAARVHVDVGRLYQLDIVPMRIFDVISAGGFVIAQHSEALGEVFEIGEEVVSWRTPAELRAKVRHYLDHPEERARIAAAGRSRLLGEHTIEARVARMLGDAAAARAKAG